MTPIIAAIILTMTVRRHLQLRLDGMRMTAGTTEHDRMPMVVRTGRFSVLFYIFCQVCNVFKEYNEFSNEKQWFI